MSRYVFGRWVEDDLDDIWNYIAEDSIDAADQWLSVLINAMEVIAGDPGIGHTRRDLTKQKILFWPVGSYLVLYRVQPNLIEIVAVTHGARDVPALLMRSSR